MNDEPAVVTALALLTGSIALQCDAKLLREMLHDASERIAAGNSELQDILGRMVRMIDAMQVGQQLVRSRLS